MVHLTQLLGHALHILLDKIYPLLQAVHIVGVRHAEQFVWQAKQYNPYGLLP